MTEALRQVDHDEHADFVAQPKLELVSDDYLKNQEMVSTLLAQHRADFYGEPGHKGMYNEEKGPFIEFLRSELSQDPNPQIAEAAKLFLKEIEGETA